MALNALTVKGKMKEEEAKEEKHDHRREIRYGAFSRVIPLPMTVKADEAKAQIVSRVLQTDECSRCYLKSVIKIHLYYQ